MSKQLNTLAPKKWVDNFEGAAPALDYSDGIRVGDFAIDIGGTGSSSSSSGSAGEGGAGLLWRCYDNTEGAPVWEKVIRTASDFVSGNLAAERMPTGGTWTLASALVIDGIHDDLGHDLVVIDGTSVAAPTEPVLKMMSSGSDGRGGRLQLYSAGTAAIDLDSGGASQISPGGTLTLDPASGLAVEANIVFNNAYEDRDFTIRKLASGNAYTYDAGLDQHIWYGDFNHLGWTGGSGVFGVASNNGSSYTQIYAEGFFCFDGTHQSRILTTAIGVGRYPTATLDVTGYHVKGLFEATVAGLNASLCMKTTVAEMKFNMVTNIFTVNNNAEDIDIAIKKLSAGDALVYDAGLDKFTLGSYLTSTDDIAVSDTKAFYLGDRSTDGTWRITRSGNNLQFERRESGSYVMKQIIAA